MVKIVVVDDEQLMLNTISRALRTRRTSWCVRATTDPAEALAFVLGGGADVLLADLRMPGIDGAELARWVTAKAPHVRTIIMTGDPDARDRLHGQVDAVLDKPFNTEQLFAAVEGLLQLPSYAA